MVVGSRFSAGHAGGTFGFEAFSWTTGEGDRQVAVAVTPRAGGDSRPARELLALLGS
jgi:hypothetical protein